jgi:hypothetical protein
MEAKKYINTGKAVTLRDLIVSGDINNKTQINIYDKNGNFIRRGKWFDDKILCYDSESGIASKAGMGYSISFKLTEERSQEPYAGEELTVRELIGMTVDMDISNNYTDDWFPALSGPISLTEEGEEQWDDVLEMKITVIDCSMAELQIDTEDPDECERRLTRARRFFKAQAGYCSESNYDKWFR